MNTGRPTSSRMSPVAVGSRSAAWRRQSWPRRASASASARPAVGGRAGGVCGVCGSSARRRRGARLHEPPTTSPYPHPPPPHSYPHPPPFPPHPSSPAPAPTWSHGVLGQNAAHRARQLLLGGPRVIKLAWGQGGQVAQGGGRPGAGWAAPPLPQFCAGHGRYHAAHKVMCTIPELRARRAWLTHGDSAQPPDGSDPSLTAPAAMRSSKFCPSFLPNSVRFSGSCWLPPAALTSRTARRALRAR